MTDDMTDEELANLDCIRAKWTMDGAKTLTEAANALVAYSKHLLDLEKKGYQLVDPIDDDYGYVSRTTKDKKDAQ